MWHAQLHSERCVGGIRRARPINLLPEVTIKLAEGTTAPGYKLLGGDLYGPLNFSAPLPCATTVRGM